MIEIIKGVQGVKDATIDFGSKQAFVKVEKDFPGQKLVDAFSKNEKYSVELAK